MRTLSRTALLLAGVVALLVASIPASADHGTRPHTRNLQAVGHAPHPATFFGTTSAERTINSDIAFWEDLVFHGNYNGFRIIDISDPSNPELIVHQGCNGDQGDLVVWENIVVRSWNSPAPPGRVCDGQPVPEGFEGVHIFDVSNLRDPELVGAIPLACGSHTVTAVPDRSRGSLIVYSNVSSGSGPNAKFCDAIDIIEVRLGNPALHRFVGKVPLQGGSLGSNNGCHDAGVILGDENLLACASGHAANVFSVGAPRGGSLLRPKFLYTVEEEDAHGNKVGIGGRWHSAAFTWDGEVLVLGWEPGGGAAPECEASDPPIKKSMFFYDADTGAKLGQWVLPRPQSSAENCTIHNYNIIPLTTGRYVAVGGHYQAGTWVTEFTNPARPRTVAWSDPPPLGTVVTPGGQEVNELGGAWSSYWYNSFIYESEITVGLNVFDLVDRVTLGEVMLDHLNPQTQEFTIG